MYSSIILFESRDCAAITAFRQVLRCRTFIKRKDAGLCLRRVCTVRPRVLSAYNLVTLPSIFENLLNLARFTLNFARYLFPFSAPLDIGIIRHFSEAFFYSAFHFAEFAFCLIQSAIFHT